MSDGFLEMYLGGLWLKYAATFLGGAGFSWIAPNFAPAAIVALPIVAAIYLLSAYNAEEWPFKKGGHDSRPD